MLLKSKTYEFETPGDKINSPWGNLVVEIAADGTVQEMTFRGNVTPADIKEVLKGIETEAQAIKQYLSS